MKKLLLTVIAMLGIASVSAQTELTTADLTSLYKTQTRGWTSIHDPSVVWDTSTQTYYIFGSHYAGAKTKDFKTYTGISNFYAGGYNKDNAYKAFQTNPVHTVKRCLPGITQVEEVTLGSFDAAAFASTYASIKVGDRQPTTTANWVSGCQWAPDIVYNPHMKKWCYYLSINGDHWASVIVLMTADKPEGPYTYQAPIVFGGFDGQTRSGKSVNYKDTDLEVVLGPLASLPTRYKTSKWGDFYPNPIDPCTFFDEDGELWMAYGSWSGGIFMLKLDKHTGLRDYTYTYSGTGTTPNAAATSDAYFGKKIAGGYYVSGEGPYIQHIGSYYYLFMSYGGFAPNEGYEMRVFRSDKPDGPYIDASGKAATYTDQNRWVLNYGPSAATNRGMKLIGAMNQWGQMKVGECAQGHNSACQDDKGRTFLVCHTKFNDGTIGHAVRAYQMYLNKFGWLCTAPFQFNGETVNDDSLATTQPYSVDEVAGDYHVLIHPYKLDHANYAEATPSLIHLSADGTVTGDYTGTWKYTDEGKSYFQIKLGSVVYNGVIVEQTLEGTTAKALCFTTVCSANGASQGVPCWGYKLQPPYAVAYNYQKYSGSYFKSTQFTGISKHMDILFDPVENVELTWTSSNPDVMTHAGKYNAPAEKTSFTMTARLQCGDYYWQKDFSATARAAVEVQGAPTAGLVAYYDFDAKPTLNLLTGDDKITYSSSGTQGKAPVLETDYARFGQVLHQYFGAQGANSYSRMDNPLLGQQNLEGFTVSMWVKRTDDNRWDALWTFFNAMSPSTAGPRLYLTGNSYVGFNDNAGNWFDINHPDTKVVSKISVGEWHLVTFTYSKTDGLMLYLDGNPYLSFQLAYTGSAASENEFNRSLVLDFVTSAKFFYLGLGSFWGSADARFDDLMIYNRALSADDVKGLSTLLNRINPFNDGTIVGIEQLPSSDAPAIPLAQQGVYDLTGRKVAQPDKGLYIVDGKKVWFK